MYIVPEYLKCVIYRYLTSKCMYYVQTYLGTNMAEVKIRQVTAEDYDDVVNIRTVYGGRDYLPGLFHDIIKRHDGFAAFVGDQMVW